MADRSAYPHAPGAKARDTATAAADSMADSAPMLRTKAFAEVAGSKGLTADEVAARLGLSILSIRPRLSELARDGKVRDSGLRRPNASGRNAIVWAISQPAPSTIEKVQ